jgi:hypothetical protein
MSPTGEEYKFFTFKYRFISTRQNDAKSEKQLQILQNDIEKKRKLPDEAWLEGTHAVCLVSQN